MTRERVNFGSVSFLWWYNCLVFGLAALYTDSCFIFVPGSHIRPRTAVEREVTLIRPYDPLPSQVVLTLEAGQTVFYNPNLLHRAVYNPKIRRATLHCAVGAPENGAVVRAAGIVHVLGYKRISWITDPAFRDSLPNGGLRIMHANLLDSLQKAERQGLIVKSPDEDERVQAYKKQLEQKSNLREEMLARLVEEKKA